MTKIETDQLKHFFSCRGAKQRGYQGWADFPVRASLRAGAGGPVQADRTSIFLGVKLMFVGVMNFRSSSKNKVRCCEIFFVKF